MEGVNFTPKSRSRDWKRCCVKNCPSKSGKYNTVRLHSFPKKGKQVVFIKNHFGVSEAVDRLFAWEKALKLSSDSSMKVCSLHFTKNDYFFPDFHTKKRNLKVDSVPSCNLPGSKQNNLQLQQNRLKRRLDREFVCDSKKKKNMVDEEKSVEQVMNEETQDRLLEVVLEEAEGDFLPLTTEIGIQVKEIQYDIGVQVKEIKYDVGIQVSESFQIIPTGSILNNIKTDSELSTATGIQSFKILNVIVAAAKKVNVYQQRRGKMSLKDRIIMTYTKMKQNISFAFLALLFNVYSPEHCKEVFFETIQLLSAALEVFIEWPGSDKIKKNMPKCFEDFEDVLIVLDCTEIFVQHSKDLKNQLITYSSYKRDYTWKIMTGVTPAGNIVYKSPIYGGRVSDKLIFEKSDLIKKHLKPGDAIMTDRGFLIDDVCDINRIKLVRPPFLGERIQFTKAEALLTSKIASARVHVERSNQRLKVFKILSDTMPIGLVPLVEDIFTVISATVNLSSPILKDDKFMMN